MIEMLPAADGSDLMRHLLGGMLEVVIDAEVSAHIGTGLHQRTDARTTQRDGTRDKLVTTAAGDLTLKIGEGADRVVLPGACSRRAGGSTSCCTRS